MVLWPANNWIFYHCGRREEVWEAVSTITGKQSILHSFDWKKIKLLRTSVGNDMVQSKFVYAESGAYGQFGKQLVILMTCIFSEVASLFGEYTERNLFHMGTSGWLQE